MGMQLTQLYRVVKFRQKIRMETYIDLKTELSDKPTTEFGKLSAKKLNSSFFGKKRKILKKKVEFVTGHAKYEKKQSKISFHGLKKIETKITDPIWFSKKIKEK